MARNDVRRRQIEHILDGSRGLSNENLTILNDYDSELRIARKSVSCRYNALHVLRKLALHCDDKCYIDMVKSDLVSWFATLDSLKQSSITNYTINIKAFFKWLYNMEDTYPDVVRWIKIKNGNGSKVRKLPTDLVSVDEVKSMIAATDNVRDAALIAVLYESAGRVGEIISLDIEDVTVDQYGVVIMVDGKTGVRRLRLIDSAPYIIQWINSHPMKDDRKAPLFVGFSNSSYGMRISEESIRRLLITISKRAGVRKHVHPHLFRHSRMTELAKVLTEQEMKIYAGWVGDSKMAGIYVHLSGMDLESKLLQNAGLLDREETREANEVLKPRDCPRCKETNPATAKFCYRCGMALDLQTAIEIDEKKNAETLELMDLVQREPRVFEILKAATNAQSG